ncbi:MAG: DUF1802 family protein [Cyanobacteria bacterium P01_F01_bin.33]
MKADSVLTLALKEWAIAVDALGQGKTIVLLRKGGIREHRGKFEVQRDRVLLYPTYEHQKPDLLDPTFARQVQPVPSGWHPAQVTLTVWAKITEIIEISNEEELAALLPFHIWTPQFARERFRWKPRQPLCVLLLRAYRLPAPVTIPYCDAYGGCKSWIDITESVEIARSQPALTQDNYAQTVKRIRDALTRSRSTAELA